MAEQSILTNYAPEPRIFVPAGVSPLHVGERNTVSNGPDDGTLNKDAAVLWNALRHGSVTQLADNLVGSTTETVCNIGGHGNVGFFETGAGQQLPYADPLYVFVWNQYAWGPQFQRLAAKHYALISIWACDTGQGQDGADLLYAIAKTAGCAVRASNGEVLTDGQTIWLETNAIWVTATPSVHPAPVGPPSHAMLHRENDGNILIRRNEHLMEITLNSVKHIAIERYGVLGTRHTAEVTDTAAQALAWRLFSTKPFKLPGTPAAFITARLEVTLVSTSGESETHRVVVYNDRLVHDLDSEDAYFARAGQLFDL